MKIQLKSLLLGLLVAFALTACSSETKDDNNSTNSNNTETSTTGDNPGDTTAATPEDVGHEGTEMNHADDWGAFKSAYANKNTEGMETFMNIDGTSAQDLLDMATEEVINHMLDTPYDKLSDTKYNGKDAKMYSYEESGTDDEGNEVGMALFFYFEETPDGLRLIGMLAAG